MAGKTFQDRVLASEVRSLALGKIKIILERPVVEMSSSDKELHDAILIRLSGTILPRLNEHTGEDGEKLFPQPLLGGKSNEINSNNNDKETSRSKEKD